MVLLLTGLPGASGASGKNADKSKPREAKAEKAAANAVANAPDAAAASMQFRLDYPDLAKMLNRDSSNLPVVRRPDGSQMIDLQGGFRSVMVVYTTPSGERVISCIESLKAAERIFAQQTPETPKEP